MDAVTYHRFLSYAFIAVVILSVFIGVLKIYLLRKMSERHNTITKTAHNTPAYEQYIKEYDKNNIKLQRTSIITLFLVAIPMMIFAFIMTVIITGSEIMGISCAIILFIGMALSLKNRILMNK
ncbi:MAG: hypothetical protein ACP5OA_06420 [Candidatus Woesearchaeota archaeon]